MGNTVPTATFYPNLVTGSFDVGTYLAANYKEGLASSLSIGCAIQLGASITGLNTNGTYIGGPEPIIYNTPCSTYYDSDNNPLTVSGTTVTPTNSGAYAFVMTNPVISGTTFTQITLIVIVVNTSSFISSGQMIGTGSLGKDLIGPVGGYAAIEVGSSILIVGLAYNTSDDTGGGVGYLSNVTYSYPSGGPITSSISNTTSYNLTGQQSPLGNNVEGGNAGYGFNEISTPSAVAGGVVQLRTDYVISQGTPSTLTTTYIFIYNARVPVFQATT